MSTNGNHSRHHAREVALQILYRHDLNTLQSAAELRAQDAARTAVSGILEATGSDDASAIPVQTTPARVVLDVATDLKAHFEHFQVASGVREFAAELVAGTLAESSDLDAQIEKFANNWKVPRMATIDRNILRMSIFEMTKMKDIPPNVTIDEAVELSKQFGTAETAPFVNAILDSIRKSLN